MIKNSGFSMFELIIVILIISLMFYYAFPKYKDMITSSKEIALKYDLKLFRDGIARYKLVNNKNPSSLQELENKGFIKFEGEVKKKLGFNFKKIDEFGNYLDPFGNIYLYNKEKNRVVTVSKGYESF